ncbi:hypothetical protein BC936DRAFT_139777 [Jimgerdemannia flammicorona]|uniref:Uncharacterized protein n=1 Tax=Jimgerdemannia flammicorona TaxID=994334 RepID=A0A433DHF3_9FUNG|nr:hypothetical protein BC936DRAFT_139777 [Jimgerdemannia flammicorona]
MAQGISAILRLSMVSVGRVCRYDRFCRIAFERFFEKFGSTRKLWPSSFLGKHPLYPGLYAVTENTSWDGARATTIPLHAMYRA